MERLLQAGLTQFIRHGNLLRVAIANEKTLTFGDVQAPVTIRFRIAVRSCVSCSIRNCVSEKPI